jgi:hypothetical protein
MIEETKCDLCGALNGTHGFTYPNQTQGESIPCPNQSKEEALKSLKNYHSAWLKLENERRNRDKKLFDAVTFWQGKFRIVCHENNKLRKKIRR